MRLTPRVAVVGALITVAIVAWCVVHGIQRHHDDSDFAAFYRAALAVRQGNDIYAVGSNKYNYPPLLAVLLTPLTHVSLQNAAALWSVGTGCLLLATLWLSARTAVERTRHRQAPDAPPDGGSWAATLTASAALGLLPLAEAFKRELEWGNCNVLAIAGIALALRRLDRRPFSAGLCLGLVFCLKYASAPMLPYLLARGRFRAAGGMVAGMAAGLLTPAAVLGWDANARYLGAAFAGVASWFGVASSHPVGVWPLSWEFSLSVPSAAARWRERLGAPAAFVPIATGCVAALWCAAAALVYRTSRTPLFSRRLGPAESGRGGLVMLEWAGLMVALVAFGPQTLQRHLNLLLPLTIFAAATALTSPTRSVRWTVAGVVVLALGAAMTPAGGAMKPIAAWWRDVGGMAASVLVSYILILAGTISPSRPRVALDQKGVRVAGPLPAG